MKLTAKELGKKLGVDRDTIYSWEYHKTSPNPRRLSEIISFLGQEPDTRVRQFYGQRILAYRKSNGISQGKLGKMLGIHKTTLRQWEKNERCPSEESFEKLIFLADDKGQEGK